MSRDSEHAMQVLVAPNRSLPPSLVPALRVESGLEELELSKLAVTDPSNLARHLAVMFSPKLSQLEFLQALTAAEKLLRRLILFSRMEAETMFSGIFISWTLSTSTGSC
jgi:hypothetical protein